MKGSPEFLIQKAIEAMHFSYSPYSHFQVGACVLSENDEIFTGCNIENASYGLSICAERTAIFKMVSTSSQRKIRAMAIVGSIEEICAPCGACRQVINEFALPEMKIYLGNNQGKCLETTNIKVLLPLAFTLEN